MQSYKCRLDRFVSAQKGIKRNDIRLLLAQGRVTVDGQVASETNQTIGQFSHVTLDDEVLQANTPQYLMLNKPAGVVSATKDQRHTTVIDLLKLQAISGVNVDGLHIAGRLDYNSTGLVLLTNDGQWSRRLSDPINSVVKQYYVTLEQAVSAECIQGFKDGIYFAHEDITTRPATVGRLPDTAASRGFIQAGQSHGALVCLTEGRYHQIKRMFGHYRNKVISLHRIAVGSLSLADDLGPGQSRLLTALELRCLADKL